MKYIVFLVLGGVTLIGLALLFSKPLPKHVTSTASPLPSPSISADATVVLGDKSYNIFLEKIEPRSVSLIPNFASLRSSQEIVARENCLYGANGGFYTENRSPLGLFYVNETFLNASVHTNRLFNGFFIKTKTGELRLTEALPQVETVEFMFQSGPLFTPETKLAIRDDEPARRVLIGKTENEAFYFLAITEKDNTNSGPLLSELPPIFQQSAINNQQLTIQPFSLFLNLDGGAASAFYSTKGIVLEELTPIGSFLCSRK